MADVLINESKILLATQRLSNPPFDDLRLGLATGAYVPVPGTVFGNLTELVGTGYARVAITGWATPILLGDGHAYSAATPITFSNSGGVAWTEVTTWFWWDQVNSKLVRAGRFAASWILGAGGTRNVTPVYTLQGE